MPQIAHKSGRMYRLEEKHGRPIDLLIVEAIETSDTLPEAAAKLEIHYVTLYHWMRLLGIEAARRPVVISALPEAS